MSGVINLKNVIKKNMILFLVIIFILIPFNSYAVDLNISKSRYIDHSQVDTWDYGINVIVPGTYTIDINATNLLEEDADDKNLEVYCDSSKILEATKVPWNDDNEEDVVTLDTSLSVGKHKLSIKSVGGNWVFSSIDLSLKSADESSGISIPGKININDKSGFMGSTFSGSDVYMNAGDFINYKIAVKDSGSYKFVTKGKFDGTDGNRLVVRLDGAELDNIECNEITSDYVEVSTTFDLPEGTHYFEIYNDDGHYSLNFLELSLVTKKSIVPIERLTKDEFNKTSADIDLGVEGEDGFSIDDAKDRITQGLDNTLGSLTSTVFASIQPLVEIFLTKLTELLTKRSGIIEKLFYLYIEFTTAWARLWLYELLLILLRVIDALMNIFGIFAGTNPIIVDKESTILINMLFEDPTILRIFWGIFIFGIALNLIFAIIGVTRAIFSDEKEKSVGQIMGQVGKSFATYAIVPLLVIFSVNLASKVLLKIDDIMVLNADGADLTFGNTLFMILSFGEETSEYEHCSEDPSFRDDARVNFYNNNTLYQRSSNSSSYFYFSYFKVWGGIILSVYIIVLLALAITMFVTRIFDLILLFIVSPYFAASISLDGGERFADWRKLFIAKLVSGFGLVIMMKLFVGIILPVITNGTIIFSTNTFINAGFMILLLTAGCYAVFKSHNLLMKLIDPQAALAEMGIAEVAIGAAHEVANIVKSEASGGAANNMPAGGSKGISNEQKNILSK